jgi:hypothetical protein
MLVKIETGAGSNVGGTQDAADNSIMGAVGSCYFVDSSVAPSYDNEGNGVLKLSLLISSGTKTWQAVEMSVSEIKPNSRRNETVDSYSRLLQMSLQNPSAQYVYEFVVGDNDLQFVIKERLQDNPGQTAILFKQRIPQLDDENSGHFKLLSNACRTIGKQFEDIKSCKKEVEERGEAIKLLQAEVDQITEYKDNLQNNLLQKFVLMLNSKKREIRRLQELIDDQHIPVRADNDSPVPVKPAPRARAAPKKTAAVPADKAKRAAKKTEPSAAVSKASVARRIHKLDDDDDDEENNKALAGLIATSDNEDTYAEKHTANNSSSSSSSSSSASSSSSLSAAVLSQAAPHVLSGADISSYLSQNNDKIGGVNRATRSGSIKTGNSSSSSASATAKVSSPVPAPVATKSHKRSKLMAGSDDEDDDNIRPVSKSDEGAGGRTKPVATAAAKQEHDSAGAKSSNSGAGRHIASSAAEETRAKATASAATGKRKRTLAEQVLNSSDDEEESHSHDRKRRQSNNDFALDDFLC